MKFNEESHDPSDDDKAENEPTRAISSKRKIVGYIRVSSKEQEKHGMSLEGQADLLRDYARSNGWQLLGIDEDPFSASSRHANSRPGLQHAIRHATAEGAAILVVSIDRLSRSSSVFKLLETSGLSILSVLEGRVGKKRLRSLVAAAEKQSAEISRRSRESADKRKTAGKTLGNSVNLEQAQRSGSINNMLRKDQKVRDLATIITSRPELKSMTWAQRAAALNAAGHLNCISEKRGEFKSWTGPSLRKPFDAALKELAFQEELNAEEDAVGVVAPSLPETVNSQTSVESSKAEKRATGEPNALPAGRVAADVSKRSAARFGSSGDVSGLPLSGALKPAEAVTEGTRVPQPLNARDRSPLERRSLTGAQIRALDLVMKRRDLSQSEVMDELGVPRLDASLWMARRRGTTVSPDMLDRLLNWLSVNRRIWDPR